MDVPAVIRVLLIDDHRAIHDIVTRALADCEDMRIVGHGGNGHDALQLADDLQPDVTLMDVVMPIMSGLEATRRLHTTHPHIKILVLSSYEDDASVREMLENGAVGYVLKGALIAELRHTIRAVNGGNTVVSSPLAHNLLHVPEPTKTSNEPPHD